MDVDFFEPLRLHILSKVKLSDQECVEFLLDFMVKNVKKKQYIVQPEFVAQYRYFVLKGALRAFVIDESGVDHTTQFAIEDWWISDYNSYILQKPATMFVEALEDSVVLQISYENEEKLKRSNHKFETIFRIMAERSTAFFQRRIISSLTQTAEERYNNFLEKYPVPAQRLPQYVIASYLGMTTEFLSKIRNNKVKRKS